MVIISRPEKNIFSQKQKKLLLTKKYIQTISTLRTVVNNSSLEQIIKVHFIYYGFRLTHYSPVVGWANIAVVKVLDDLS